MESLEPRQMLTVNLGLGDVAFTGYQATTTDKASIVLLKSVDSGTVLTLTDNAWNGSALGTTEGNSVITFGATFTAGTQLNYDASRGTGLKWAVGSTTTGLSDVTGGNFAFNATGDNVFAYNGSTAPTSGGDAKWVAAFATNAFLTSGSTTSSLSFLPTAFTLGSNAFSLGLTNGAANENAAETSPASVSGTPAQIRTTVYTIGNWTTFTAAGGQAVPPAITYTVSSGNTNPTIGNHAGTYNEGAVNAAVATSSLRATDAEQGAASLTFTLTSAPAHGTLKKSGSALAINGTFTQADIDNSLITYSHDGSETTSDGFNFTVSDGAGGSATGTFNITVTPVNDAPTLVHNLGLSGVQVSTTAVVTTAALQVTDPDNTAAQLTYTVGTAPTGTLKRNGSALSSGGTFTQADIDNNLITYVAPATGTADSFTFTVSDGSGGSIGSTTFNIALSAAPNTPPTIAHNLGLSLNEGASATVATGLLQVTDAEQGPASLTYTVDATPTNGNLKKNGIALAHNDTFTQADIDANLISYTHDGGETTADSFTFTVSDGAGGSIGTTNFAFTVAPVNDAPTLATNLGLTLLEGASGTIGSGQLAVTDVDNTAAELTYTIGAAPAHGTLFKGGTPLAANDTFTQADVNANAITYTHDGGETTGDSFTFSVSDGVGGMIGTTSFAISVTPVNDPPTITLNRTITINPGQTTALSNAILAATDVDTTPGGLVYTVTTGPTRGSLKKNSVAITSFTQADLNANDTTANAIRYTTTGNADDTDSIVVSLSDGTTTLASIVINISIVAPTTASYSGGTYSQNFDDLLPTPIPGDNSSLPSAMVLPPGWIVVESGFGAGSDNSDSSIRIDSGLASTGDTDLFGAAGSNERALGSVSSGSLASKYGVALVNNSSQTYSSFTLSYIGEQWRDGGSATAILNKLSFDYSTTAASLSDATGFTAATALDFNALHNNNTADVTLNGNDPANQSAISATVTGLTWAPGQTLFLRWSDANETGNDDALAIDGLTFSATNPNTSPEFTSTDSPSVNENSTAVLTLAATDAESPPQVVAFSITGGADQGKFSITGGNQLIFNTAPDFEAPTDADANNTYLVDVTADDGAGGMTVQHLTVSINPLSEGDYNHNGVVDAADYVAWRSALGSNVTPYSGADGDGSGVVDQADYGVWMANFGNPQFYGVPGSGTGAAPEASVFAAPVTASLAASTTPASVVAAAVTSSAHDEIFVSLVTTPVTARHGIGAVGAVSDGQAGLFRSAWLQGLLLEHAGSAKPQDPIVTKHAAGSTADSNDIDAVDHCFATMGALGSLLN